MSSYKKGANAERELIAMLESKGFATLRAAGSAKHIAPDCIALSKKAIFAFECKAVNKKILSIKAKQMKELLEWSSKASVPVFIAWRLPRKKWIFIAPEHFHRSAKHYAISLKEAERKGVSLELLLKEQTRLRLPKPRKA